MRRSIGRRQHLQGQKQKPEMASQEATEQKRCLKILVTAHEGIGHVNAALGLAEALRDRGHKIVFVVTEAVRSFVENRRFYACEFLKDSGKSLPPEFAHTLMSSHLPSNQNFGGKSLRMRGILSGIDPLAKMYSMLENPFPLRVFHSLYLYEDSMEEIVERQQPDLVLIDHFAPSPSLIHRGIPWIYVHSASALYAYDDADTPPPFSGYPTKPKKPAEWAEFKGLIREWHAEAWRQLQLWYSWKGFPPLPESAHRLAIIESPFLNIYQYPAELDYLSIRPQPTTWTRVETFSHGRSESKTVREKFTLPEEFMRPADPSSKLIYFSLGTLGCFDTLLMGRLIASFSRTKHRFIVSKGALGEQVRLPANMYGANYLPQVEIIQLADMVITHGGNNTFTETFAAGKPMLVMPLFADQYDNGQRLEECGYGRQVNPYKTSETELFRIIDQLLNDEPLKEKLQEAARRIKKDNGIAAACERIEALV